MRRASSWRVRRMTAWRGRRGLRARAAQNLAALQDAERARLSPQLNAALDDGRLIARRDYEMALVHPRAPCSYDVPIYGDSYRDALEVIDVRGHVPVPQGPGLGVEIDWDWVSRHQTAVVEYV